MKEDCILIIGNIVIDVFYWVVNKIKGNWELDVELEYVLKIFGYDIYWLDNGKKFVLIIGYCCENFGDGFILMCKVIKVLIEKYFEVDFVYLMYLNFNVRKFIYEVFGDDLLILDNMFFIEFLEYLLFVYLMEKVIIVLMDSGGI